MDDKTDAGVVAELATRSLSQQIAGFDKGNQPFVVVPQNARVESLQHLLPAPLRTVATRAFITLESFCRYVSTFKQADTRIELKLDGNAKAVIDANGPDSPAWEGHTAQFVPTYSPQWKIWHGANAKKFTQKEFATFIEDNISDVLAPAGGVMLDIARDLQVEQSSNFSGAIRLDNGDVQLNYVRQTTGKVGQKGDMEIPSQFTIQLPVLAGEAARQIECRLKYDLNDGRLTLSFEVVRLAALLEEVIRSIEAVIANDTGIKPFYVA
jgi:uncharacterized protein YfdQ (DUF2303 family)